MTFSVLHSLKGIFSRNGAKAKTSGRDPGAAHFSDSEIACLRQQVRRNSESATKIREARGSKPNPKIVAARTAGAKI